MDDKEKTDLISQIEVLKRQRMLFFWQGLGGWLGFFLIVILKNFNLQ